MKQKIALMAACLAVSGACAQDFPSRPLKIVVPYGAGGTPDLLARVIADGLSAKYGQPVVVENKPGATGILSAQAVLGAPADGYTLWIADNGQLAINPSLYAKLPYDPLKDFAPVRQLVAQPFFIWANKALQAQSFKDVIAQAKDKPGGINYGTAGNGSPHHLCLSMAAHLAGVSLTHVPYKSAASQLVPAMISNEVSLTCTSPVTASQMVATGKVEPLAVAASQRARSHPNVPTFAQATGLPDLVVEATIGVLVKAGTPKQIVDKLAADVAEAINRPEAAAKVEGWGMTIVGSDPTRYAHAIREEQKRYGEMVKISGARIE